MSLELIQKRSYQLLHVANLGKCWFILIVGVGIFNSLLSQSEKAASHRSVLHYYEQYVKGIYTLELVKDMPHSVCRCRSYITLIDSSTNGLCYDTLPFPDDVPSHGKIPYYQIRKKYANPNLYSMIENDILTYGHFNESVSHPDSFGFMSTEFFEMGENKIRVCFEFSGFILVMCNVPEFIFDEGREYLSHILDKACWKNNMFYGPIVAALLKPEQIHPLSKYQIEFFGLKRVSIKRICDSSQG